MEIPYSFSYGHASGTPADFEQVINVADINMYENKTNGTKC